jgi:hypothetical protein
VALVAGIESLKALSANNPDAADFRFVLGVLAAAVVGLALPALVGDRAENDPDEPT